ncbi:MAG: DmsC/YnfH family molybdoenzyme membrane anchor subunit [Pseudomonadota bacterium]
MHPAPSLIVFTVLSGLGLGMIFWLGLGYGVPLATVQLADGSTAITEPFPAATVFSLIGPALAFVLAAAGGAASSLHLARPDRAWRAFSQWRSSWLSREACLMVAALGLFALYAGVWILWGARLSLLGWLAAGFAAATVYATAMIYGQLATVPRWSLTPTPALFLALAALGGLIGVEAAARLSGGHAIASWALFLALALVAGMVVRWQTAAAGAGRRAAGSDIGTATGLGRLGRVRAFEAPHTGTNYLLDEMAFRVGRRRAYELRLLGAALGFGVPLVLLILAAILPFGRGFLALLALVSHGAGIMALRWLFFAEAEHVQALYYGQR